MNQPLYQQLTHELQADFNMQQVTQIIESSTNHIIALIRSQNIAYAQQNCIWPQSSNISTEPSLIPSSLSSTPKSQIYIDIITRRNKFIQDFSQKQIECQQFAIEMIKQAAAMKVYYQSKKQKEKEQKEAIEKQKEQLKIEMDKAKKESIEKEKIEKHRIYIQNRKTRKEFICKFIQAKVPKRDHYHYSQIKEDSNESINTKESIDFQSLREHQNNYLSMQREKEKLRKQKVTQIINKSKFNIFHNSFDMTAGAGEYKSIRDSTNNIKKQTINNIARMKMFANVLRRKQVISSPKKIEPTKRKQDNSCTKLHTQKIVSRNIFNTDSKPWQINMSTNQKDKCLEPLPEIKKYKDYLSESRRSHVIKRGSSDKIRYDKVIRNPNLNAIEKYNFLKPLLETVEERAHIKEQNIISSRGLDGNSFEDATNIYINAIKAKLSLLEEF